MIRFYKMWLEQLHRHLQLHSSPSHSVATRSPAPLGHLQAALKRRPEHVTWSADTVLPWLTLLLMALWLIHQSWKQAQGSSSFGPMIAWSRNNASMPSVVPVNYTV